MVNRIKDRQTGEYHEIGGLKCKLVASGELIDNESSGDGVTITINFPFESNKLYLLELYHQASEWNSTAVIKLDCYASIPFADENEELSNLMVSLFKIYNGAELFIKGTSADIIYGGETYTIYELPFALEG